ncbi:hypothetical protein F7725_025857 [Dissostichus mawsoni]|uniref:HECT domain-containing protein n=1 Tax=Dissostichus mawsoni TaxID=36200 RepID=A0A7J5X5G3_DISMA|nr:hypothetical protein F7725_025857 [Dissostichus mawsoni]
MVHQEIDPEIIIGAMANDGVQLDDTLPWNDQPPHGLGDPQPAQWNDQPPHGLGDPQPAQWNDQPPHGLGDPQPAQWNDQPPHGLGDPQPAPWNDQPPHGLGDPQPAPWNDQPPHGLGDPQPAPWNDQPPHGLGDPQPAPWNDQPPHGFGEPQPALVTEPWNDQTMDEPAPVTLIIRRGHCLTDLIKAFTNPDILNTEVFIKMRLPNGKLEEGEGSDGTQGSHTGTNVCNQVLASHCGALSKLLPQDALNDVIQQKTPTGKAVKELLQFPDEMTPPQTAVARYLKRYVGEVDLSTLQLFLRFCTGSNLMEQTIKIQFIETSNFERRPQSHTCGCLLKLPVGYHNYPDLRSDFNSVLTSSVWVMDII